jgi:hypothetical protein
MLFLLFAGLASGPSAQAVEIVLQPNEAASKDTFVYENFADANFDTTVAGPIFGSYLGAAQTTTPHTTESYLQFDFSGVTLTAAEVTSATLELHAVNGAAAGFGVNPAPANPVLVDLFAVVEDWSETLLTWNTPPPAAGSLYAQTSIDGINQAFTFDVTDLVKDWLDGSLANKGLALKGNAPVPVMATFAAAAFSSSSGAFAPKLTIVPEPSGVVLALSALAATVLLSRRRLAGRHRIR